MLKVGLMGVSALAVVVGASQAHAQTPIPPSPKDYVMAAAQSDHYEVLAAHVAVAQARDPRVKAFAQQMIRDHDRLDDDLRQAAMAAGLPAPDRGMSSDEASLLGSLQSARGADFDKSYARQQDLVHAQAVAVTESFANAGSDPTLRKAAKSALPTIQDHLKMARQLRADLDGS